MKENTWTVIHFLDDGTVEAVPSTWIQGDQCHWPSFAQPKLQTAIQKCEPLNTCWPSHTVKIFRSATYDDYIKARMKAKVAEDTSDLNTETEENSNKRRRIQKILTSSDDSINEIILPPPPKLKKYTKKLGEEKANKENRSSKINIPDGPSNKDDEIYLTLESTEGGASTSQSSFEATAVPALPTCQSCIEKDKNLKILIHQGHILRGLITDTLAEVKTLRKEINVSTVAKASTSNVFFNNPELKLPIETDKDFAKVESFVQNEENFNNADHVSINDKKANLSTAISKWSNFV